MLFKNKIESYRVREFLAGHHKQTNNSPRPLYGILGLDITSHSMFSSSNFNLPYIVVFGVAGVILISTLIENILIAHGNPRQAERVEG